MARFKKFRVSLTLRRVEGKDEEEARAEFYRLVSMGAYDSDLVEVEEEVDDEASVVVDGKIITSRAAGTAAEFSLGIIEALIDRAAADKIKSATLVK